MAETFGQVLRSLRESAELSLSGLAARTHQAKATVADIEKGRHRPSAAFASACDLVFGTAPLMLMLVEMDERQGDSMKRRALLATLAGAIGASGLGGASALADVIRHGALESAGATEDWDAVVNDYARRLVTDPSDAYGGSLLMQLAIARQQNIERGPDVERLRAVAQLSHLYGLWLGNRGEFATARGWYRSASHIADRSGDPATRVFVRARTVSRGIYEGYTGRETVNGVEEALSISRAPSAGVLEAYSALVCFHCLTGNLPLGRKFVQSMQSVAEGMPDVEATKTGGAIERTISFQNYVEGRIGPRKAADKAFAEADSALRAVPVWHADAKIYYAHALVRDGDVTEGISLALEAVNSLSHEVRVLEVGVRDVLHVVPQGHRSDALDELSKYASVGPAPWETIA